MKNSIKINNVINIREKNKKICQIKLEKILLIMHFKRYYIYKTFQEILEYAKQNKLSLLDTHLQVSLKIIFEELSLDLPPHVKEPITIEIMNDAFQKLDIFIQDYENALNKKN